MFIGRDRFGIRPAFYTIDGSTIAVCSEMKGLIGIGDKVEVFPARSWMHITGDNEGKLKIVQD